MDRERCWRVGEACVAQLDARQRETGRDARCALGEICGEEEGSDVSTTRLTGTGYDGQVSSE